MGKASSAKASRRGGGAAALAAGPKKNGSRLFIGAMVALVLVGVVGVALAGGSQASTSPGLSDHWHEAYGIDICGTIEPDLPQPLSLIGIHTHSDGLIHVEPFTDLGTGSDPSADEGANATLARFAAGEPGFSLTTNSITYPGGPTLRNGDPCEGRPGVLTFRQWPVATANAHRDVHDPSKVKIVNGAAVEIAFLPAGADIPKPARGIAYLENPANNLLHGKVGKMPSATTPASTSKGK